MRLGNAWVKAISKMLSCSSSARPRGWSNARDLHGVPERGAREPARPAHAVVGAGVWGDLLAAAVRGDSVADDQTERSAERYDGADDSRGLRREVHGGPAGAAAAVFGFVRPGRRSRRAAGKGRARHLRRGEYAASVGGARSRS